MDDHRPDATSAPASRQAESDPPAAAGPERVAKALARAGVASRRAVERLIGEGRVALNGRVLDTPAIKVEPGDILTVDGKVVDAAQATRVWRYHKPTGLMTTHLDPAGRPTVFAALPRDLPRVISIGRLDINSEGLLLLTNDGELARALELPSSGWVRRYRVRAYGRITQTRLDELAAGITVDGVVYGPLEARIDKVQEKGEDAPANLWISVAVAEGKNREVRRVLEAVGLQVNRLIRLAYGPFALGTLALGEVEEVGPRVIREQLHAYVDPRHLPTGERAPPPLRDPDSSAPRPGAAGRRAQAPSKGAVEIDSPRAARQARRKGAPPTPPSPTPPSPKAASPKAASPKAASSPSPGRKTRQDKVIPDRLKPAGTRDARAGAGKASPRGTPPTGALKRPGPPKPRPKR